MRAICYARTSTLDQAREDKVSIPTQINWAKTTAKEKDWEFVNEYIEPGVFGDIEPEEREAFSRLWTDAKLKKFDVVLVYHSSRFAREADIGMKMCRVLGQLKVQTFFRNSPIEPVLPDKFSWGSNIGGIYMTAFSFIGDFQENVARSERVRSGFYGLAGRGKLVNAPFGYIKQPIIKYDQDGRQRYDWTFEIDPPKAMIAQRIFNEYAKEGGSLRQIMLNLNKELVGSPSGKVGSEGWNTQTIRNILQDVAYIGKVRWGRKLGGKYLQGKSSSGKQKRILNTADKWIVQDSYNHKGFIETSLFNRVQEKLKVRANLKGRAVSSKGLLTGIAFCGKCGRKAYFKHHKCHGYERESYVCSSYFIYKSCQRHIMSAPKLHNIVMENIDSLVANPDNIQKLLEDTSLDKSGTIIQQLEILKKEFKDISVRQERILIAYETNKLSLDEFGKAKERLDKQAVGLQEEILKLEQLAGDKRRAEKAKKNFMEVLKHFKDVFPQTNIVDFDKQKDYIRELISSIIVKGDDIQINYRL